MSVVSIGKRTPPPFAGAGDFINVKDYGATGNGVTDDTAAIAAAWNVAAAVGGITYLPAGTYAVDPATIGIPPPNLHLLGDGYGSSLKIKSGSGNFQALLIWAGASTGVTISNLKFDGNAAGYGGTIQNNPGAGDYEARTARMLLFSGAVTDLSIIDCWFVNQCGVHVMLANNANNNRVRFDRNTVIWSMNAANIAAVQDYDNSMVYIAGPVHVSSNNFIQPTIPTPPYGARGAIETIGGPAVVSNNLFTNFRTPIYMLGSFGFPTTGSVGESVFSGNTISGANQAIRLWPSTQGGKISITGNQIYVFQVTHNRLNCCGIWVEDDPTFNMPIGEVAISGNTITFEEESPAGRATDYAGSALIATDCVGIGAPSFNTVSALNISGNVIKGSPAYGIALGRINNSRASTIRNTLARNNQVINAGQNIALANTSRAGVFLTGNCENVTVADNQIADSWGAFSTLPYSTAAAGTFLNSQQYQFLFDLTGAAGTSQGSNPISLTPQTNNTQIKLGIRLDNANVTSVGIYADTAATPKRVGTIAVAYSAGAWTVGAITYDGTSSGLSAAVSGTGLTTSVLTVTLSNPQAGSAVTAAGSNGTGSGATAIPLTRGFYGVFAGATGTSYTNVHVEGNSLWISANLHGGGVRLQTSIPASIITDPMTTVGDMVYASITGTPATLTRLPIGSASQVLVGGAVPSWGAVPDAALSANVPLDNTANVFTASQTISVTDSGTNTEPTLLTVRHRTSGTAAIGLGSSMLFTADSNNSTIRSQASLVASWLDATDATRKAIVQIFAYDATTAREGLRVASTGTVAQLGFFGHSGAIKPSITGALSSVTDANAKAVLQSLINAFKTASGGLGLVADTTT